MFLAFPLNSKPDWRHPPWMTILLIVINCLVYFGPQLSEEKAWDRAASYYAESQLPQLELPRYIAWLRQAGSRQQIVLADRIENSLTAQHDIPYLHIMESDSRFQAELRAGLILRPDESGYDGWRRQRIEFDHLKGQAFTARWASNPADWNPLTLISATFLHGSATHLIGNMLFLFAFGYTVELALGASRYLLFYLIAGFFGGFGDLLARWGSPIIGLGASGAISGLMAMYVVFYGRQRIRFFYQLLFYFDYVKAPAIILLPVWIAHEFLQQWLNHEGGVAYMAHAGGLISGGLLAWWYKRGHPAMEMPAGEEALPDPFIAAKAQAESLLKAMKTDQARAAYAALAVQRPQDRGVVGTYFNLARLASGFPDLDHAATFVFKLDGDDEPTLKLIVDSLAAYAAATGKEPPLSPDMRARLTLRLARTGYINEAETLALKLLALDPDSVPQATVLLSLTRARLKRNEHAVATGHARVLQMRFPGSSEAQIAADLLR